MKREFLTQFMERLIVELEREQRDGTAHVYQSTLKRLKKFANGREVRNFFEKAVVNQANRLANEA